MKKMEEKAVATVNKSTKSGSRNNKKVAKVKSYVTSDREQITEEVCEEQEQDSNIFHDQPLDHDAQSFEFNEGDQMVQMEIEGNDSFGVSAEEEDDESDGEEVQIPALQHDSQQSDASLLSETEDIGAEESKVEGADRSSGRHVRNKAHPTDSEG